MSTSSSRDIIDQFIEGNGDYGERPQLAMAIAASLGTPSSSSSSSFPSLPLPSLTGLTAQRISPPPIMADEEGIENISDEQLSRFIHAAATNDIPNLNRLLNTTSNKNRRFQLITSYLEEGEHQNKSALHIAILKNHRSAIDTMFKSNPDIAREAFENLDKDMNWEEELPKNSPSFILIEHFRHASSYEIYQPNSTTSLSSSSSVPQPPRKHKPAEEKSQPRGSSAADNMLENFFNTVDIGDPLEVTNVLKQTTEQNRFYLANTTSSSRGITVIELLIINSQLMLAEIILSFLPANQAEQILQGTQIPRETYLTIVTGAKEKRSFRNLAALAEKGDSKEIYAIFLPPNDPYVLLNTALSRILVEGPDKDIFQIVKDKYTQTGEDAYKETLKTMLKSLSKIDAKNTLEGHFDVKPRRENDKGKECEKSPDELLCEELMDAINSRPPETAENKQDKEPSKEAPTKSEKQEKQEVSDSSNPQPAAQTVSKATRFIQAATVENGPDIATLAIILSSQQLEPSDKNEIQQNLSLVSKDTLHHFYSDIPENAALFRELTAYLFSDPVVENSLPSSSSSSSGNSNLQGKGNGIVLPPLSNSSASNLNRGPSLGQVASDVDILLGAETPAVPIIPSMDWGNRTGSSYSNPFGYFGSFNQPRSTGSNPSTTTGATSSSSSSSSSQPPGDPSPNNNPSGPGTF